MNNWKKYLNHVLKNIFFSYEKRLDKLDLGENFISSVPQNMFNNTLSVNDLNLDYNYIESLQENAFKSISPRRIYLGMNRIRDIHPDAFSGLETTLELLDLERNSLNNVSRAFDKLQNLRYLYFTNNISSVLEDSFQGFGESLRALSLIRVFLGAHVTKLSHLNIVYNDIAAVTAKDFMGWADSVDTIMFRNNKITHQEAHTFRRNLESMDKFSKTSEGLSKDWKVLTTNEKVSTQAPG